MWRNDDPRHAINKRATIIVTDGAQVSFARVETKHSWYIELGAGYRAGVHSSIDEAEEWPAYLYWAFLPEDLRK
jgi:hypothetical protein